MSKFLITSALVTALLATPACAEDKSVGEQLDEAAHEAKDVLVGDSISKLPASGEVTVSGTVEYIDSIDNEFTLKDTSGQIDVESNVDLTVAKGDHVTVTGTITEDMGEKEIAASKITVSSQAN